MEASGAAALIDTTADREELLDGIAEGPCGFVALSGRQEGEALGDVFGSADEMAQAGLPPAWLDRVVGGITVGDEIAGEVVAEDGTSHLRAAGRVDVEEGELRVACIPEVGTGSINAPMSFIAVDDFGRPDLVA